MYDKELYEILDEFGSDAIEAFIVSSKSRTIAESSLDTDIDKAKQAILDWHNKQIEVVLDRLESKAEWLAYDDSEGEQIKAVDISAIEAERNKLRESK